jgi:hypothetical protein
MGEVCRMHEGDGKYVYNISVGKSEMKRPPDIDRVIILKWMFPQ